MNNQTIKQIMLKDLFWKRKLFVNPTPIVFTIRHISFALVGASNDVVAKSVPLRFKSKAEFFKYLELFIDGFSGKYMLTNKSKISGLIEHLVTLSLIFNNLVSTKAYRYLSSNNLTFRMPTGFAKLIDYVAQPLRKTSIDECPTSIYGEFEASSDLSSISTFLRVEILNSTSNIKELSLLLAKLGYAVDFATLNEVLKRVLDNINLFIEEGDSFEEQFRLMSRLSSFIADLDTVDYTPLKSCQDKLTIYKFRSSPDQSLYFISKKGFDVMHPVSQQICCIALHLLRPVFYINGKPAEGVDLESCILDLAHIRKTEVYIALWSTKSVNCEVPAAPRQAGPGNAGARREYSTLAGTILSIRANILKSSKTISSPRLEGSVLYVDRPLMLTLRDYDTS